jgi:hypothetical protein
MGVVMRIVVELPPTTQVKITAQGITYSERRIRRKSPAIVEAIKGSEPVQIYAGRLLFAVKLVANHLGQDVVKVPAHYFVRKPYSLALRLVNQALLHAELREVLPSTIITMDNQKRVRGVITGLISNLSLVGFNMDKYFVDASLNDLGNILRQLVFQTYETYFMGHKETHELLWLDMKYWENGVPINVYYEKKDNAPYGVLRYNGHALIVSKNYMSVETYRKLVECGKNKTIFFHKTDEQYLVCNSDGVVINSYFNPDLKVIVFEGFRENDLNKYHEGILVEYIGNKLKKKIGRYYLAKSKYLREAFIPEQLV